VLAPLRKIPHAAIPGNEFPVLPNLECNGLAALDTQNIRDFPATQPRIAREVVGSKGTIEGLSLRALRRDDLSGDNLLRLNSRQGTIAYTADSGSKLAL
jgi:hypothetical protein